MKFLIIEDSKTDTEILTRYVQKSFPGALVHSCANFRNGITCLSHDSYDYIFLDLNLPDNWGISTVRDIKPYSKNTPVFVVTSMAHDVTVEEALKAGATSVNQKRDISCATISQMVGDMALVG